MAQNPFDSLAGNVFDACERVMGYDASWLPSVGGTAQTARVLFGEPTKDDKLGEFGDSFNPQTFFMEWWEGTLTGLFEAVRDNVSEDVTITFDTGDRTFYVRHVFRKYDGKNYRAMIEEVL